MAEVTSGSLKETMMDCYQSAATLMQHGDREGAQYMRGYGDAYKFLLVDVFGCEPEKENAGLKDLLAILEDL